MSKPTEKQKSKLVFDKGSSALAHMDEFMEKHAAEIEELEQRFGKDNELEARPCDNAAKTTFKKAA